LPLAVFALLAAALAAPAQANNPNVKIFRGPGIPAPDQQQTLPPKKLPARVMSPQPLPLESPPAQASDAQASNSLPNHALPLPAQMPRAQAIPVQMPREETLPSRAPTAQMPRAMSPEAMQPQATSSDATPAAIARSEATPSEATPATPAPPWQLIPGFQLDPSRAMPAELKQFAQQPSPALELKRTQPQAALSQSTPQTARPQNARPNHAPPQHPLAKQTLSRRLQGQPLPIQWTPAAAEPLAPPLPHEDAFETAPAVDYTRQPLRQPGRQTAAVKQPNETASFSTLGAAKPLVKEAAWGNDENVPTPAAPDYSGAARSNEPASRSNTSALRDNTHALRDDQHSLRDDPAAWRKSGDSPRIYTFASREGSPVPDYDSVALRNDAPNSPSPAPLQTSTPRSGASQFATSLFAKDGPEPIADDYHNSGSNNSGSNNFGNPFGDSDAPGNASSDLIDDGSFLSGESGASGSNGGCDTCGADDCDGSCNPCYAPYGFSAAVEATYLKPHYRTNNDQFDVSNNFNYEAAPRVWIQWQNKNGWGLRGRYWDYDADQQASSVITEETAIAVFNSADNLRLYTVDLELTRTFMLGATQTVASIGARNGQFRRNITQQISIFDFAGGGADDASAILRNIDRTFNGTGLTLGLGFRRPVAGTRLAAVCNLRGSVLWGGDNFNYSFHVVEVVPVGVGDLDLNDNTQLTSTGGSNSGMWIGELQAGGEWNTPLSSTFGGGNAFVRVLFEGQWWNLPSVTASNDVTLSSQVYDFLGVTAAIGFTR
jgi:hypothetical protein